jgi:hypothetical protein
MFSPVGRCLFHAENCTGTFALYRKHYASCTVAVRQSWGKWGLISKINHLEKKEIEEWILLIIKNLISNVSYNVSLILYETSVRRKWNVVEHL